MNKRLVLRYFTEQGLQGKASFRIPDKKDTEAYIGFIQAVDDFNAVLKKYNIQATRSIEDDT